jgi:hypothetical protein
MNQAWHCGVFILLTKVCFEQALLVRFGRTGLSLNVISCSTRSYVAVVRVDKL